MSNNTTSGYNLSSKAMLVSLKLRAWGGTKKDQSETTKVARSNRANEDAVSVTKNLVGKLLDPVRQSERAIRAVHKKYSLPWSDDSTRLLPVAVWDEYNPAINTLIEKHRDEVIPAFAETYRAEVVPGARQRLGDLFDPADFPDDIEGRFGVIIRFLPVPEVSDVRVKMSDAEVSALKDEVESATREAFEAAGQEITERAMKPLTRLAEALREYGPGKKLSKALVDNVIDIAELIPMLDISGRPEVTALANEIKSLGHHSTSTLAVRSRLRASVAADAERLIKKMENIF
jgi:hypothetical protein